MKIEILGIGCPKCAKLYKNAEEAITASGVTAELVKVTSLSDIARYGVMSTPALVVDGEVKATGKALSVNELVALFK